MRLSAAKGRALAPALPMPYNALAGRGLWFRRGQLSLTVAAPGSGKSMLWLNLAQRMGVPALYWSADTDQHDVLTRVAALWSGRVASEVDAEIRGEGAGFYEERLASGGHVEWVFEPSITAKATGERLNAFAVKYGQYPFLLVVDNLSNTVQNTADELSENRAVMVGLQRLARETGAHIAVLAHAAGQYEDGTTPIPQSGALNKLYKLPEVGLTLFRDDGPTPMMGVCVVKNRSGAADPAAKSPVFLDVDFSRAWVGGFEQAAA